MSKKKKLSVVETLKLAFELFRDGKGWTQQEYARDKHRNSVAVEDPEAVRFCSLGALRKIDGPNEEAAIRILAETMVKDRGYFAYPGESEVEHFNDKHSWKTVKKRWLDAIELAEKKKGKKK